MEVVTEPNRLLLAGVAAPIVFVGSFLVQGAVRPGYDPLRHPVSALSLGPGGWVQMLTFWVTGALIIAFALGLRAAGVGRATPILIAIVGLGLIGAGFAACDPISGYPVGSPIPAPRTAHGIAHDLFSTPVFTLLPAAMIVMARRSTGPATPFGRGSTRSRRPSSSAASCSPRWGSASTRRSCRTAACGSGSR